MRRVERRSLLVKLGTWRPKRSDGGEWLEPWWTKGFVTASEWRAVALTYMYGGLRMSG